MTVDAKSVRCDCVRRLPCTVVWLAEADPEYVPGERTEQSYIALVFRGSALRAGSLTCAVVRHGCVGCCRCPATRDLAFAEDSSFFCRRAASDNGSDQPGSVEPCFVIEVLGERFSGSVSSVVGP
jgi:hypothetical protein